MRAYLSYMKMRFATALQYRSAAIASISTQFFFGAMYIMIYEAYYKNGISTPLPWDKLVTYIWLMQAFFSLTYFSLMDNYIRDSIITGQVAYELVRPFDIYWQWFSRLAAGRIGNALMRCWPILIVTTLLPTKYALKAPVSLGAFALFLITLILGLILTLSLSMVLYTIMFYITSSDGLFRVYSVVADFFGGGVVPIPFMPKVLQIIAYVLPFRLSMDLPYRLYVGNISINEGIKGVITQIIWVTVSIILGKLLMKSASKKVVLQGG